MPFWLKLLVRNPVPEVWAAIQQGKGSAGMPFGLVQKPGDQLTWELTLDVRNGQPTGPFVQSDGKGRFVYVLWGTSAGQMGTAITRRAKIYLPDGLNEGQAWQVEVAGRGDDGGPVCATVKEATWTRIA